MTRKIRTSYVNPAIPYRGADWVAYYDGEEEKGEYGYGATEAEATQDLVDMFPNFVWLTEDTYNA